ncbi:MAG: hypothetical protein RL417_2165 [Pseudomonadota bacterium]
MPPRDAGGEFLHTSPVVSQKTLELIGDNPSLYTCRVLRAGVEGRGRVLLLLGESHLKSEAAGTIGEAVIAEFADIGVEGAVSGTVPRCLHKIGDALTNVALAIWPRRSSFVRVSSIDDAETMAHLGRERINFATEIVLEAQRRGLELQRM